MKLFLFLNNDMSNVNPLCGHDIDKFVPSRTITLQFEIHLLNFRMAKDPEAKFKYTFRMVNIYFVLLTKKHDFLTPLRKKRGLDKLMITPLKTRNVARLVKIEK